MRIPRHASGATASSLSSHGRASSRSKISRASVRCDSASSVLPCATSHSPCSSCVTASQKGKPYSRKLPAAVLNPASLLSIRARKRCVCASRNGGRSPGGSCSTIVSSSFACSRFPRTSAASTAQTRPCFTAWFPAPTTEADFDRFEASVQCVVEAALRIEECGPSCCVDRAVLDVDGLLDEAEVREKLSCLGQLTPMEVDLEDTGEHARECPPRRSSSSGSSV